MVSTVYRRRPRYRPRRPWVGTVGIAYEELSGTIAGVSSLSGDIVRKRNIGGTIVAESSLAGNIPWVIWHSKDTGKAGNIDN